MFIGYQNDRIAFVADTREELENMPCVTLDKIEEVEFAEMFNGKIYILEEELTQAKGDEVRSIRNQYLETYVDPKQLVLVWNSLSEEDKKLYTDYRIYLLDYTKNENWYLQNPKTLEEWKNSSKLVEDFEEIVTKSTILE